jgi:hypothetical protein
MDSRHYWLNAAFQEHNNNFSADHRSSTGIVHVQDLLVQIIVNHFFLGS